MPTHADEARSLIADTRLMVAYAARFGQLVDCRILQATDVLEDQLAAGAVTSKALSEVTRGMHGLARAIAPVTLADLGSSYCAFPKQTRTNLTRAVFAAASVLVAVAAIWLTNAYATTRSAADALTAVAAQDFPAKAAHFYRDWLLVKPKFNDAYQKRDPELEDFFKEYDEVRALDGQIYLSLYEARNALASSTWLEGAAEALQALSLGPRAEAAPHAVASAVDDGLKGYAPAGTVIPRADRSIDQLSEEEQRRAVSAPPVAPPRSPDKPVAEPSRYYSGMYLYLTDLGLSGQGTDVGAVISAQLARCRDMLALYGVWILPAIYGLLGGMVYQLRAFMAPQIPNPTAGSLVVRLALAAMAGVSTSWIQSSVGPKLGLGAGGGLALFGLAFVLGFGIDVFFAALDRLVTYVSRSLTASPRAALRAG
jgi:hypothetical protein